MVVAKVNGVGRFKARVKIIPMEDVTCLKAM